MPAKWPAWARRLRGLRGAAAERVLQASGDVEFIQQAAAVQGRDRRRRQAAYAERQLLERRLRVRFALQHKDGAARQRQFAGEEKTDGTGAGDDDVERR